LPAEAGLLTARELGTARRLPGDLARCQLPLDDHGLGSRAGLAAVLVSSPLAAHRPGRSRSLSATAARAARTHGARRDRLLADRHAAELAFLRVDLNAGRANPEPRGICPQQEPTVKNIDVMDASRSLQSIGDLH
jgi:hypothetical protein